MHRPYATGHLGQTATDCKQRCRQLADNLQEVCDHYKSKKAAMTSAVLVSFPLMQESIAQKSI